MLYCLSDADWAAVARLLPNTARGVPRAGA